MPSISDVSLPDFGDQGGAGVALGVGGVEAVDVGQQHQRIGADHLGHAGGQPVVVAEADFRRGHRVVLVDDRHGAELQQGVDGVAGVEVAAALFGVVQRQQDLRHGHVVAGQRFLIGMGKPDLAGGGGGLFLFQPQRPADQAQMLASDRDGAG